jgi:hypothetical protein
MLIIAWSQPKDQAWAKAAGQLASKQLTHRVPGVCCRHHSKGQALEIGQGITNFPAKFIRHRHTHSTTPHHHLSITVGDHSTKTICTNLPCSWAEHQGRFITTTPHQKPNQQVWSLKQGQVEAKASQAQGGAGQARRSRPSTKELQGKPPREEQDKFQGHLIKLNKTITNNHSQLLLAAIKG